MSNGVGQGYLRSDFRVHSDRSLTPHWLTRHIYGRELLLAKLRAEPSSCKQNGVAEDDATLERMVDELGLRHWSPPATARGHAIAVVRILIATIPLYWRSTDWILRKQIKG